MIYGRLTQLGVNIVGSICNRSLVEVVKVVMKLLSGNATGVDEISPKAC